MADENACPQGGSHRIDRYNGETFPGVLTYHCFSYGRDFTVDLDTSDPAEQEAQDNQDNQDNE
jgi:hypothetical protein